MTCSLEPTVGKWVVPPPPILSEASGERRVASQKVRDVSSTVNFIDGLHDLALSERTILSNARAARVVRFSKLARMRHRPCTRVSAERDSCGGVRTLPAAQPDQRQLRLERLLDALGMFEGLLDFLERLPG